MIPTRSLCLLALLVACTDRTPPKSTDSDEPVDSEPVETDGADTDEDTDVEPTGPDGLTLRTCPALPPATSGVCDAVAGIGDQLVLRGDILGDDEIWEDGLVVIDGEGMITCVGCACDIPDDASVVTCPDGVISPGLINPHEHMTFSEGPPVPVPATRRYDHRHDWRGSLSTPSNAHGTGATGQGNQWVEIRQLLGGTTSMVGSGSANGMVRNLDASANEGLDAPEVDNQTFPLGDSNESVRTNCDWNYADDEREVSDAFFYLPHVAEGINDRAAEEFRCLSTSFDGGQDLTEPNTAHIHGVGLTTEDYYVMATEGTKLVWSPRSNISLYGQTAQVTLFHRLGGVIALGTDWSYSGSIHPVRELACADQLNRDQYDSYFSDVELWRMVTSNAAAAVGMQDKLGHLTAGHVGDVAIFDGRVNPWHRAVLNAGATDLVLVLRGGLPLFGENDTLIELGDPCDGLNVCGAYRGICAAREFGTVYEDIASVVLNDPEDPAYPAFFCGEPDNEPTCVPSRPGEYAGPTAEDADGDGLADGLDACPNVFDPIRPMDDGVQPDRDSDGDGDACDETPLPDDLDGDGYLNDVDNCPLDPNDDQIDMDNDGKGDLCDFCALDPNPVGICPLPAPAPTSIVTARTTLPDGTRVQLQGVVVTGVGASGYFAQDPNVANGQDAGIYVFSGGAPIVERGDVINLVGELATYFDERQVGQESVVITAQDQAEPAPVELTVAQAMTETYEGTLVTLTDGAVSDADYDCGADSSLCSDAGLWEINADGVLVYDRLYDPSDWDTHIGTLPVTGIMGFRFERRRIMPRDADDFGN
jgi:cytosine/adenosine deaminase-related metal-dependent hydrolase